MRPRKKRAAGSIASRDTKKRRLESHKPTEASNLAEEKKTLKSHLKHLCIEARNREMVQKVSNCLLKAAKKQSAFQDVAGTLPPVFPVSSKAYREMRATEIVEGFPSDESTGIPALGKWLRGVLFPHREDWVDSDLHHIMVLSDAAYGWIQEDFKTLPTLSANEKKRVKQAADEINKDLKASSLLPSVIRYTNLVFYSRLSQIKSKSRCKTNSSLWSLYERRP